MNFRSKEEWIKQLPRNFAMIVGIVAATLFCILFALAISRSTSSTAAIAWIFLPVYTIIVSLFFAFIGANIGMIAQGILACSYRHRMRFYLAIIITVPLIFYLGSLGLETFSTYRYVNSIAHMNTEELTQAFMHRPKNVTHNHDIYILAALAQNRHAGSELLNAIAHLNEPRLHLNLRSLTLLDLTQENHYGFSVIRLVVQNPNVSIETLKYLSDSNNFDLLSDLAANPKLPAPLLRKLYLRAKTNPDGYLIKSILAGNPNTPADVKKLLK